LTGIPTTALLLVAGVLGGCGAPPAADGSSGEERLRRPVPADARESRVVRVIDGDTLVLAATGTSRIIGVDTPEVFGRSECFGAQASHHLKRLLPTGTPVFYRLGRDPQDRYGRALIGLWLPGGRSIAADLVAGGFARVLTIAPNTAHAAQLRRLQRRAKRGRRGLWSVCDAEEGRR